MRAHEFCAWILTIGLLASCSSGLSSTASTSFPSFGQVIIRNGVEIYGPPPASLNEIQPAAGRNEEIDRHYKEYKAAGFDRSASPPGHCRLKDRFDRKDVVAYHFSDGKSKLGLDLDVDGFSFSELGDFEMEAALINFRYRFQPIKKRREKCLYPSSWQGLFGSGYNELIKRESHTVYEELDQELERAQRQVEKLFSY